MGYIYTMKYYSAIKRKKITVFAATWMDREVIMLSEVSQTNETPTSNAITYMWNLKKEPMNFFAEQILTHRL